MKTSAFVTLPLLVVATTLVTHVSHANSQYGGNGCEIIDLSGRQYYVNNSTQYIQYNGPLLTNSTGTTVWATCPLALPTFANFHVDVMHTGIQYSCVMCRNDMNSTTCYNMSSYSEGGSWFVEESSTYSIQNAGVVWGVQCKLRPGDAIQGIDIET